MLGLQVVTNVTFSTFHKIKNKSKGHGEKQGIDYIASLPSDIRNQLYRQYEFDFTMFGYTQYDYEL